MERCQCTLILCLAFVIAILFQTASSFRCYQCNSYMQEDCADHFNNQTWHLSECPDDVNMCRKIVQEVYYNDQWNLRYIRQCAARGEVGGDEGRQCLEKTGTNKVKIRICHCNNQEGCNSASKINGKYLAAILSLLTFFIMNRH